MISVFLCLIVFARDSKAEVKFASDLNCSFNDRTTCRWRNDNDSARLNWFVVDRVAIDSFHSIPRGSSGLGDYFAGIQGENSLMLESAVLVSDVISCQESSGTISFLVWKSAIPAILRVCVRTPPTSEGRLECRQNVTNFMGFEWVPISIVIPVSTEPFQLVLIAEVQRMTDTIGIDNITYSGQICETSQDSVTSEPTAGSNDSHLQFDSSVDCDVAECSFEVGICDWEAIETTSGSWRSECSALRDLTSTFSAPQGSCFLTVTSVRNDSSQILASRPFFAMEPTFLEFFYFVSVTQPARLSLCVNSFDRCVWQTTEPPRKLERWWKDRIRLAPGRLQIFFVVDQLQRLSKLALDGIRLVNMDGKKAKCEEYEDQK